MVFRSSLCAGLVFLLHYTLQDQGARLASISSTWTEESQGPSTKGYKDRKEDPRLNSKAGTSSRVHTTLDEDDEQPAMDVFLQDSHTWPQGLVFRMWSTLFNGSMDYMVGKEGQEEREIEVQDEEAWHRSSQALRTRFTREGEQREQDDAMVCYDPYNTSTVASCRCSEGGTAAGGGCQSLECRGKRKQWQSQCRASSRDQESLGGCLHARDGKLLGQCCSTYPCPKVDTYTFEQGGKIEEADADYFYGDSDYGRQVEAVQGFDLQEIPAPEGFLHKEQRGEAGCLQGEDYAATAVSIECPTACFEWVWNGTGESYSRRRRIEWDNAMGPGRGSRRPRDRGPCERVPTEKTKDGQDRGEIVEEAAQDPFRDALCFLAVVMMGITTLPSVVTSWWSARDLQLLRVSLTQYRRFGWHQIMSVCYHLLLHVEWFTSFMEIARILKFWDPRVYGIGLDTSMSRSGSYVQCFGAITGRTLPGLFQAFGSWAVLDALLGVLCAMGCIALSIATLYICYGIVRQLNTFGLSCRRRKTCKIVKHERHPVTIRVHTRNRAWRSVFFFYLIFSAEALDGRVTGSLDTGGEDGKELTARNEDAESENTLDFCPDGWAPRGTCGWRNFEDPEIFDWDPDCNSLERNTGSRDVLTRSHPWNMISHLGSDMAYDVLTRSHLGPSIRCHWMLTRSSFGWDYDINQGRTPGVYFEHSPPGHEDEIRGRTGGEEVGALQWWEDVSCLMQKPPRRRFVKLWAMKWEHRFSLYRHVWSHLEGNTYDQMHLPEIRNIDFKLQEISTRPGREFLVYDPRIETPILLQISCVTSEHIGTFAWDCHPRVRTSFSLVMWLCDGGNAEPDWTCWGEDPTWGTHLECGAEIVAYPGMHLKVYQRILAPISDSESTGICTNGTTPADESASESFQNDAEDSYLALEGYQEDYHVEEEILNERSREDDDNEGDETGFSQAQLHSVLPGIEQGEGPQELLPEDEHLQVNTLWMANTFTNRPSVRSVEVWHMLRNEAEGTTSTTQLRFETPRLFWQDAVNRIESTWRLQGLHWSLREVRDELLYVAKRAKALVLLVPQDHQNYRTGFVEVVTCLHDGIQTTTKIKTFRVTATYDEIYHALGLYVCMDGENCEILLDSHDYSYMLALPRAFTMQIIVHHGEIGHQMITPWVMLPFAYKTSFAIWRARTPAGRDHLDLVLERWHHWNNVYKKVEYEWKDLRAKRWWASEVDAAVFGTTQFHDYDKVVVVSHNHAAGSLMSVLTLTEITLLDAHEPTTEIRVFHFPPAQDRESILKQVVPTFDCDTEGYSCSASRNGHELRYYERIRFVHGDFVYVSILEKMMCEPGDIHFAHHPMEGDEGGFFQTAMETIQGRENDDAGTGQMLNRQGRLQVDPQRPHGDPLRNTDRENQRENAFRSDWLDEPGKVVEEMRGLAQGAADRIANLKVYGLTTNDAYEEVIRVDTTEIGDYVDVLVILRETLSRHIAPWGPLKHFYVNPQPTPRQMQGFDYVHILSDLHPRGEGHLVLVVICLLQPDGREEYEPTPLRVGDYLTCEDLLIRSRWHAVCEETDCRCYLDHWVWPHGRRVATVPGKRYDVEIEFGCSDNPGNMDESLSSLPGNESDETSHMQIAEYSGRPSNCATSFVIRPFLNVEGTPDEEVAAWIYTYMYQFEEPLRLWRGGFFGGSLTGYISDQVAHHIRRARGRDVLVSKVVPQPRDMVQRGTDTYVSARFSDLGCHRNPVLVDLIWVAAPEETSGDAEISPIIWRQVGISEHRTDRITLIHQLRLDFLCLAEKIHCQIKVGESIWPPDDSTVRLVYEGDHIEIRVQRPFGDIPLDEQWSMLKEGTTLDEIRQRYRVSCSHPDSGEGDGYSLVQSGRPPLRYRWIIGFLRYREEPTKVPWLAPHGIPPGTRLARSIAHNTPFLEEQDLKTAQVDPNPEDLDASGTLAFVLCPHREIQPWQVVILVDIRSDMAALGTLGWTIFRDSKKRFVRVVDFQVELDTLLTQVGVDHLCTLEHTKCTVSFRDRTWHDEEEVVLRLEDGNYITVDISLKRERTLEEVESKEQDCESKTRPPTDQRTDGGRESQRTRETNSTNMELPIEEENVLMQMQRQRHWFFLYTLGVSEPSAEELQGHELEDPFEAFRLLFRSRQQGPGSHPDFCYVQPVPRDLAKIHTTPVLYHHHGLVRQGYSLVMVDVEIYGNTPRRAGPRGSGPTADDEWREISQVKTLSTRSRFLADIGITDFCEGEGKMCILMHKSQVWTIQDSSWRELQTCDYLLVKVRKDEDIAHTLEQNARRSCVSSEENGGHGNVDGHAGEGEESETFEVESHDSMNTTSLLQIRAWMRMGHTTLYMEDVEAITTPKDDDPPHDSCISDNSTWYQRPSPQEHARYRLRPPGNGPPRVGFSSEVEDDTGGCRRDFSIENVHVHDFVSTMERPSGNSYMDALLQDIRFEDIEEGYERIPKAEGQNKRMDDEITRTDLEILPILSTDYNFGCPAYVKAPGRLDLRGATTLRDWMEQHVTIPCLDVENVPWQKGTREWLQYPIWILGPTDELHFYMDGSFSSKSQQGGAATMLWTKQGDSWSYGGFLAIPCGNCSDAYVPELQAHALTAKWCWDIVRILRGLYGCIPTVWLHYDNHAATMVALGKFRGNRDNPSYVVARSLYQILQKGYEVDLLEIHEKSHQGNPGNEGADVLAKKFLGPRGSKDDFWHYLLSENTTLNIQWIWTLYDDHLPIVDGFLHLPGPDIFENEHLVKELGEGGMEDKQEAATEWHVRCATYNAMTLDGEKKKPLGSPGKVEELFQQCHRAGIHVIAVQETRLKKNVFAGNPWYFTLQSRPNRYGGGGLLIGLSKKLPICKDNEGQPIYFEENDLRLIYQDQDLLLAKVQNRGLKVIVGVLHCPHTGQTEEVVRAWWQKVYQQMSALPENVPLVILGDLNSRLGSRVSSAVGGHQPEEENFHGCLWHEFLLQKSLWLPATFDHIHWGSGCTWVHPNLQIEKEGRIDYIALPETWRGLDCQTWVDPSITCSPILHDHKAALLDLWGPMVLTAVDKSRVCRRGARIQGHWDTPEAQEALKQHLAGLDRIDWKVDVHRHADLLHRQIRSAAERTTQEKEKMLRKKHLQLDTWHSIKEKQTLRRRYFGVRKELQLLRLRECFDAWTGNSQAGHEYTKERMELQKTKGKIERDFVVASEATKTLVRRDDNVLFDSLTKRLSDAEGNGLQKALWKEIKRLLPKHSNRRQLLSAQRNQALADEWIPHLCRLEAGEDCSIWEVYTDCLRRQEKQAVPTVSLEQVPSLLQLEDSLMQTKADKAGGPDGVEPKWVKLGAPQIASKMWDLTLKISILAHEPFQWKGGQLAMIPKKIGAARVDAYRGIMLSSILARRHQALVREDLMKQLVNFRPEGQMGGYAHQETSFGAQTVRTMMKVAYHAGYPTCIIFVDLQAAYHSLVRQLITGRFDGDEHGMELVRNTLKKANLNPSQVDAWLSEGGMAQRTAMPEGLQAMLQELNCDTWAGLQGRVVRTHKGSRPGSPLADALFHCVMSDIVIQLQGHLDKFSSMQRALQVLPIPVDPIVWADDLAVGLITNTNEELNDLIPTAMTMIKSVFNQRGMIVNFGKSKTEALPTYVGLGARHCREEMLRMQDPGWTFKDSQGDHFLRLQARYRHLGAMQQSAGMMEQEVSYRIASTWEAFRQIHRGLLGNRGFKVKTRLQLFQSLILSRLLHGCGSWPELRRKTVSRLKTAYMKMLRLTVGQANYKDKNQLWSDERILAEFRQPHLLVLIISARLN